MPDIMKDYDHLNTWDEPKLFARQQELKGSLKPGETFADLSDEYLQELLAINRVLRKRTTAPTAKPSSKRAPAPSLDAL